MKRAGILIAVVLALLLAAPASADHLPPLSIPGERPADAQVLAEVRVAVDFWRVRGVTGCPDGIRAFFVDGLPSSDGHDVSPERGGDCGVWLDGTFSDRSIPRFQPFRGQVEDAADECAFVVHGVGHALGLDHSDDYGGVMNAVRNPAAPRECRRWAPWWVAPVRRWWRPGWGSRR